MRWLSQALALGLAALLCFGPPLYLLLAAGPAPLLGSERLPLAGELLGRTCALAACAALVALPIGALAGWALAASRGPARAVLLACAPLPLLLPPYLAATAWARLCDRLARAGWSGAAEWGYSWLGSGLVLGLALHPLVALPLAAACRRAGGSVGRSAGALLAPLARLRWWLSTLSVPLLGGAALVFALAAANLAVPLVLRTHVFSLEAFTRLSLFDRRGALLATLPLLALSALALLTRFALARERPAPEPARDPAPRPWRAGLALLAGASTLALSVGAPLALLCLDIDGPGEIQRALATAGDEVFVSLEVALYAGLLMSLIGLIGGAGLARAGRWRWLAAAVVLAPLVIPGAAVGLGLQAIARDLGGGEAQGPLAALASPGSAAVVRYLSGTTGILVLAACARYLPFALLVGWVAAARRDPRPLEAARLLGLGPWQRLWRVRLPLLAPDLMAAFAFGFAFTMGELTASAVVEPPGVTTLAVRLASLLHFGEDGIVSALCLLTALLVALGYAIASLLVANVLELRLDDAV